MRTLSTEEVAREIAEAEEQLDPRALRLWERVRVQPTTWHHAQYPDTPPFWVVGVMGTKCLYFNSVEGGWGWGRFAEWGHINEYHWQQLEIQYVLSQTLFAIDRGGAG